MSVGVLVVGVGEPGPTYTTSINVCAWAEDTGTSGYLSIPVTLNYSYDCGGYTCYDFVYKVITMIVC